MATTSRSAEAAAQAALRAERTRLPRFDTTERVLHWVNATLFFVLMGTGAILYIGQLSTLVGRRDLVRIVHVVAGLFLPYPLLMARFGPWRAQFRADVRRLGRFDADDRRWLRSLGRDKRVKFGKFHPGQKLNASFTLGAVAVMFMTGAVLHWYRFFPLSWRTGATFAHDWFAIAIGIVVLGHLSMALNDQEARRGMRLGWVSKPWARRKHPKWYEETTRRSGVADEAAQLEPQPGLTAPGEELAPGDGTVLAHPAPGDE